jgi:hypothetical protein
MARAALRLNFGSSSGGNQAHVQGKTVAGAARRTGLIFSGIDEQIMKLGFVSWDEFDEFVLPSARRCRCRASVSFRSQSFRVFQSHADPN